MATTCQALTMPLLYQVFIIINFWKILIRMYLEPGIPEMNYILPLF